MYCNNFVITIAQTMEIPVIKVGNSKGLRLSKQIIDQYHITNKVEMILENDQIVIKPIKEVRQGWSEAFQTMSSNKEDDLLIDDVLDEDDIKEWN